MRGRGTERPTALGEVTRVTGINTYLAVRERVLARRRRLELPFTLE